MNIAVKDLIPAWVEGRLQPLDKLAVHRQGLRHPAVSVFVLSGSRVLIQQRAADKYHSGGLWANTCCTHPYWGEAPLACAIRRLTEELGITGLTLQPVGQVEYRAEVPPDLIEHELVDVFVAEAPLDLTLDLNPEEVQAVAWVDLDALDAQIAAQPARFTPWLRIYLSEHRAQILGR
ncbi:isopentenyl-diphosphate delta-isomerase [Stagnihabitans tardus]|uniref:Isopentenyl-diphosphate Delta-isomerase n=1 Tax=Stagnihabitans tardus TaxID=2699202 RepID=A0AAE5BT90_9RHOB|nr:isopentenyl-diphosphate delta-isomerase [Stagnihabitans tardus]NBZ86406.1 isopentenyl-diphosphate delta-isomerase [Stagnihabitans tardus]